MVFEASMMNRFKIALSEAKTLDDFRKMKLYLSCVLDEFPKNQEGSDEWQFYSDMFSDVEDTVINWNEE